MSGDPLRERYPRRKIALGMGLCVAGFVAVVVGGGMSRSTLWGVPVILVGLAVMFVGSRLLPLRDPGGW